MENPYKTVYEKLVAALERASDPDYEPPVLEPTFCDHCGDMVAYIEPLVPFFMQTQHLNFDTRFRKKGDSGVVCNTCLDELD